MRTPSKMPIVRRTICAVAILLAGGTQPSYGAQFRVDITQDLHDTTPDGICAANAVGLCSLRAAVEEANLTPGPDEIVLQLQGSHKLKAGEGFGEIEVTESLTITGTGAPTVIDGDNQSRIFHVVATTERVALTLGNLTLKGGNATGDVRCDRSGGAVCLEGDAIVTIAGARLEGNKASFGGAIAGAASISSSVLTGNTATDGTLNGTAPVANGIGGAIFVGGAGKTVTVDKSTISGNSAGTGGGGG